MLYDSLDPLIIDAFRNQPSDLSVIRALRTAIKVSFQTIPEEKLRLEMERFELLRTIPELRTTIFDEMIRNIDLFADIIAERTGHSVDDLSVRNLAGAVIGVALAAMLEVYKRPKEVNSLSAFDKALARLERGLAID